MGLIGTPERTTLDLNALAERGVTLVGRLAAIQNGKAHFSGSLRNHCAMADLKLGRLLDTIDQWLRENDGHRRTRHRVHVGGDERPLEGDVRREAARQIDDRGIAAFEHAVLRPQQEVVERAAANRLEQRHLRYRSSQCSSACL